MLDFIDISIVFLILVLIGYAWYTVKLVLQERKEEEVLWVETKNMHYIPFTLRQLQSALLGVNNTKVGPQVVQWKEFLLKTELVFGARYHLLKASLLEDYEPFDPNREGPSELPDPKLAILEDRFLSNFRHTMEKANFDMLTDEEAATASASNFLNTVPIVPEWLKMDPLFERYMEKHPELSKATYGGAKRLWVFHRGVGVATATGVLFMQKLDSLLLHAFGRCCGKKKDQSPEAIKAQQEAVARQSVPVIRKAGVERISIESIAKQHGWGSLFKSQTIQEPTFKEIFLVYRINHNRVPEFGSGNARGIYLKSFRDIPHADLEVCYPCKITSLRPLDVVKYHQSVYEQTTLKELYAKSRDSDQGALTYAMEQVALQETKEVFLGYYFLANSPRPLTQDELDEQVEAFLAELQTVFGHRECKIDFEADDSLGKLINMKLISEQDGKYSTVPLTEAIEELNTQWGAMLNSKELAGK